MIAHNSYTIRNRSDCSAFDRLDEKQNNLNPKTNFKETHQYQQSAISARMMYMKHQLSEIVIYPKTDVN